MRKNVITLSFGFVQHLLNVGEVFYDSMNLPRHLKERHKEDKQIRGYWNELGPTFGIRGVCYNSLLGEEKKFSMRFYQQAVREVFRLDVPRELDHKRGILDLFYRELGRFVDLDESEIEREKEIILSSVGRDPWTYKSILEENATILNEVLIEMPDKEHQ